MSANNKSMYFTGYLRNVAPFRECKHSHFLFFLFLIFAKLELLLRLVLDMLSFYVLKEFEVEEFIKLFRNLVLYKYTSSYLDSLWFISV